MKYDGFDNNQEQQKMGADCTKSYQAQHQKKPHNRTLDQRKNHKNHWRRDIIINASTRIADRQNAPSENSSISFYSQVLNSFSKSAKFVPQIGFQNAHSNGKPINYQIYFKLLNDNQNSPKIQITVPEDKQVWKKISSSGMYICEGNQIKMGKTKMKLKYWMSSNQISKERQSSTVKLRTCQDPSAECRFCLESSNGSKNPLVMPCKCQGSVSAVHQRCLSDWIFNYTGSFHEDVASFCFKVKQPQCQICKQSFQNYIWNRLMVLMSAFEGYYAVFQVNPKKDGYKQDRQYAVFRFNSRNNTLSIGKSPICEYISTDDYMCDIHTLLQYSNGKLFVKDNESKHGTYVAAKNKYLGVNEIYKIGHTYFSIRQVTPSRRHQDWV